MSIGKEVETGTSSSGFSSSGSSSGSSSSSSFSLASSFYTKGSIPSISFSSLTPSHIQPSDGKLSSQLLGGLNVFPATLRRRELLTTVGEGKTTRRVDEDILGE
ncbi:hypothetical protein PIB30_106134 [Stylosanthes scabra]|uniref:Uncharacterized protein n=1 Tax=Stylosanthes scabra TaxID=79078 RepID=A0ABU6UYM8_9FABA|nr:hypothetical protein [Stylosanthes scabra]